ncbi:MAG: FAD-dependent oxidoreductase [Candidatus Altiarchaeota archaeon]|nr:FAD-dependent oxidoreductase [Candidatus Altiarchaeota archaeon]
MKDIIIIGAGPAGMGAAIYAQRYGMQATVIDQKTGGIMVENPEVENYPGMPGKSGSDIGMAMQTHTEQLGAEFLPEKVLAIKLNTDKTFTVKTDWDKELQAKTVVIATGLKRRKLGAKNEEKFSGHGVSYCATCDAAFFKDKMVVVVGGGDSAAVAAFILCEFAKKVTIIYRRDKFFRMKPPYLKKLKSKTNITTIFSDEVVEVNGKDSVESITLKSGKTMDVQGVFIEIGFDPQLPFATEGFTLETDEKGFIKVGADQMTNVPGLLAAGDITTASNKFYQIVTAVSEGAISADTAHKYWLGE